MYEMVYKYGLKYRFYGIWYLHPTTRSLLSYFKSCDFVINAPGGICMGGFQVWEHLMFLEMAQLYKKDIYYYGRSFGPFPTLSKDNIIFKELSIGFLKSFKFLSIRDSKTEIIAKDLKINYVPTVDSAFLDSVSCSIPSELDFISKGNYMVFVPNSLVWHYAYKSITSKEKVISFYSTIIKMIGEKYRDYYIVMLPQLFNSTNGDYDFFKEIMSIHKDNKIVVLKENYSSDIQQMIIKNASFVIGARYHSIVFSINQNTPFIALSYEHKIEGLLQKLGFEDNMVKINDIWNSKQSQNDCLKKVQEKLYNIENQKVKNERAKFIANRCFYDFCETINKCHYGMV